MDRPDREQPHVRSSTGCSSSQRSPRRAPALLFPGICSLRGTEHSRATSTPSHITEGRGAACAAGRDPARAQRERSEDPLHDVHPRLTSFLWAGDPWGRACSSAAWPAPARRQFSLEFLYRGALAGEKGDHVLLRDEERLRHRQGSAGTLSERSSGAWSRSCSSRSPRSSSSHISIRASGSRPCRPSGWSSTRCRDVLHYVRTLSSTARDLPTSIVQNAQAVGLPRTSLTGPRVISRLASRRLSSTA